MNGVATTGEREIKEVKEELCATNSHGLHFCSCLKFSLDMYNTVIIEKMMAKKKVNKEGLMTARQHKRKTKEEVIRKEPIAFPRRGRVSG